jgi:hypothetical protein
MTAWVGQESKDIKKLERRPLSATAAAPTAHMARAITPIQITVPGDCHPPEDFGNAFSGAAFLDRAPLRTSAAPERQHTYREDMRMQAMSATAVQSEKNR